MNNFPEVVEDKVSFEITQAPLNLTPLKSINEDTGVNLKRSEVWSRARSSDDRVLYMSWGHDLGNVLHREKFKQPPKLKSLKKNSEQHQLSSRFEVDNDKVVRQEQNIPQEQKEIVTTQNNNVQDQSENMDDANDGKPSSMADYSSNLVEFIAGERLFFGCKVALESVASGRFLCATDDGTCHSKTTNVRSMATTFTVVDLDDVGSNGMIKYGDTIWLQSSYSDLVGARITYDAQSTKMMQKVGVRVGKPVMKKMDRNSNLTAKWNLVDPLAQKVSNISGTNKEVGHLSYVCFEQDWYYLADDEESTPSLRQGIYCPDGVVSSALTSKEVEKSAIWRIHLLHNGTHIKTVARDEQVLSYAQKQLKQTQERITTTIQLTKHLRKDMRKFAKASEAETRVSDIERYFRNDFELSQVRSNIRKRWRKRVSSAHGLNSNSQRFRSRRDDRCYSKKMDPLHMKAKHDHLRERRPHTSIDIRKQEEFLQIWQSESLDWLGINPKSQPGLWKARARANAIAAEALVSSEVWMEIHAQEAKIEQEIKQQWNTAAYAVQRAWKRWARGKWKRKFEKVDTECRKQLIDDQNKTDTVELLCNVTTKARPEVPEFKNEVKNIESDSLSHKSSHSRLGHEPNRHTIKPKSPMKQEHELENEVTEDEALTKIQRLLERVQDPATEADFETWNKNRNKDKFSLTDQMKILTNYNPNVFARPNTQDQMHSRTMRLMSKANEFPLQGAIGLHRYLISSVDNSCRDLPKESQRKHHRRKKNQTIQSNPWKTYHKRPKSQYKYRPQTSHGAVRPSPKKLMEESRQRPKSAIVGEVRNMY